MSKWSLFHNHILFFCFVCLFVCLFVLVFFCFVWGRVSSWHWSYGNNNPFRDRDEVYLIQPNVTLSVIYWSSMSFSGHFKQISPITIIYFSINVVLYISCSFSACLFWFLHCYWFVEICCTRLILENITPMITYPI
jgi:hypothetical protein